MFRIEPLMPAHMYKTYSFVRPLRSHWRTADCEESGCTAYANGWITRVDESSELGRAQAHYIRHDRTRKSTEDRTPEGLTAFTFPPGQKCFQGKNHKLPIERDPVFLVKGGDHRGNPMQVTTRVCRNASEWIEDFDEHQHLLADAIKRG